MSNHPAIHAACAMLLLGAAPAADPLLARIVADAGRVSESSFAFERSTRIEADGKASARIERFQPAATPRWTLVSLDGAAPDAKASQRYAREATGQPVPNYGRLGAMLASGAERMPPGEGGEARYRVARLPEGSLPGNGAAMARHLTAEVTIAAGDGRPYVRQARIYAAQPFRMMLIAKVDKFEALTRYAPGADGRVRVLSQDSDVTGKIPGRAGTIRTRATYRPI